MVSRLVCTALLSLFLMTADHKAEYLQTLRSALSTVVYPLQYAVHLPISGGVWLAENLSSRDTLIAENERLKVDRLRLQVRLEKLVELESENRRLRNLLDSSVKTS